MFEGLKNCTHAHLVGGVDCEHILFFLFRDRGDKLSTINGVKIEDNRLRGAPEGNSNTSESNEKMKSSGVMNTFPRSEEIKLKHF